MIRHVTKYESHIIMRFMTTYRIFVKTGLVLNTICRILPIRIRGSSMFPRFEIRTAIHLFSQLVSKLLRVYSTECLSVCHDIYVASSNGNVAGVGA